MNKKQLLAHGIASAPALLYTASPLDYVPDAIPVAGQADDAMVILLTLFANVIVFLLLRAYAPEIFREDKTND